MTVLITVFSSCSKQAPKELTLNEKLSGRWNLYEDRYGDGTYIPYDSNNVYFNLKSDGIFSGNVWSDGEEITNGT